MSQERIELLLRAYEALNRGDIDVVARQLPSQFEFVLPPMVPEHEVYRGPDGLRRAWETWSGTLDNFRIEVEETIDAGDQVIVMAAVAGTASGLDVSSPTFAWVWSFEGDTVVRMEAMPNRATALEAVGLKE
jgi:ketosteroid isomerase-like protein